jgi:hypothetical protein
MTFNLHYVWVKSKYYNMYNLHTLLGVVGERMKVFLPCTAPTTTRNKGVEGVEGVMQPLPEFPLGSTYVRYE